MKIGIYGICGRMGRSILKILIDRGHELAAGIDSKATGMIGVDAGKLLHMDNLNVKINELNSEDIKDADGIIDFTSA